MDKEDCIHALLSTLQKPQWKLSSSVTDWDLKNVLWEAGLLLSPEQAAALFADMKRRGLISGRERRSDNRIVAMWGVRITPVGEDWLLQRVLAASGVVRRPAPSTPSPADDGCEPSPPEESPEAAARHEIGTK